MVPLSELGVSITHPFEQGVIIEAMAKKNNNRAKKDKARQWNIEHGQGISDNEPLSDKHPEQSLNRGKYKRSQIRERRRWQRQEH